MSYSYDGDGLRFSKSGPSGTVYYVRDGHGQVMAEYSGVPALLAEYIYLDGQRLCKGVPTGSNGEYRFYYHPDVLGTPLLETDDARQVVGRTEYYPFGEEVRPGSASDPHKFTGKELDSESGLYYFGARYYDAHLGRFVSVDPVAGRNTDPQSWNRYVYAENRPTFGVDRDGRIGPISPAYDRMLAQAYAKGQQPSPVLGVAAAVGVAGYAAPVLAEFAPEIFTFLLTQGPPLAVTATEALNPNPGGFGLPASVAATFKGGEYTTRVLAEDALVFRAEGRTFGKFFGGVKPTSAAEAERLYNVADYGNDLLQVSTYRIPKGTTVYEGQVAGGEGWQLFVQDPRAAGVQLLQTEPLVQYGH